MYVKQLKAEHMLLAEVHRETMQVSGGLRYNTAFQSYLGAVLEAGTMPESLKAEGSRGCWVHVTASPGHV